MQLYRERRWANSNSAFDFSRSVRKVEAAKPDKKTPSCELGNRTAVWLAKKAAVWFPLWVQFPFYLRSASIRNILSKTFFQCISQTNSNPSKNSPKENNTLTGVILMKSLLNHKNITAFVTKQNCTPHWSAVECIKMHFLEPLLHGVIAFLRPAVDGW